MNGHEAAPHAGEAHDDVGIPVSKGPPTSLVAFAALSLLIVFGQGAAVCFASNFGKVFPSINSTKCKLPAPNTALEQACPSP